MELREATRKDLPKGREAQCVLCWKIFGSDSTCELHKPYRKPVAESCKDPATIGLEVRERRGLKVWVAPSSSTAPWKASGEPSKLPEDLETDDPFGLAEALNP